MSAAGVWEELFGSALIAAVTVLNSYYYYFLNLEKSSRGLSLYLTLIFASATAASGEDPEGAVMLFCQTERVLRPCVLNVEALIKWV